MKPSRRMKTTMLLAALSISLGCIPAPNGKSYFLSESEKVRIEGACEEIDGIGDLRRIRAQIARDMERIKGLLRRHDVTRVRSEVLRLGERVRENSTRMMEILGPEFVEIDSVQSLQWNLAARDLGLREDKPRYWSIHQVTVEEVYNWQGEIRDFKEITFVEWQPKSLTVRLERPASAVEICQLQETLVIQIRVDYKNDYGQARSARYQLLARNLRGRK